MVSDMREQDNWSLNLGRWAGVQVQLHMFFLLFAAFTLLLGWGMGRPEHVQIAALSLGILALSVLFHELGHCLAARRLGGNIDQIVLGPLGGLGSIEPPEEPRDEMVVHLSGPLINGLICLICAPILLSVTELSLLGLMHPLSPSGLSFDTPAWILALKLTFWINWMLMLVNLIPAFPFDGGQAMRAGLSLLWERRGFRHASSVVARIAQVAACVLLLTAWLVRNVAGDGPVPPWFALVLMSIFLFFSARHQPRRHELADSEDDFLEYDFSDDYTDLEHDVDDPHDQNGPLSDWFYQRNQTKLKREQEIEAEDERCIDEVLARLHQLGMERLSDEDRALLQRVSARYRNRLGHRA